MNAAGHERLRTTLNNPSHDGNRSGAFRVVRNRKVPQGTKKAGTNECLPAGGSEVFRSPTSGSSGCHAVFHPLDHLAFVPDDSAGTQLDLLREGSVPHAVIDEGLAHPRHLKHL